MGRGGANGLTPVDVGNNARNYYDAAAHYLFNQEALRGRYATVRGKLRFDLAPGTTVRLVNADSLFLGDDQLNQDRVASITRVSTSISADPPHASTAFQLEHVRTADENEDDKMSAAEHPFYVNAFSGSSLVDAYLFPEEA